MHFQGGHGRKKILFAFAQLSSTHLNGLLYDPTEQRRATNVADDTEAEKALDFQTLVTGLVNFDFANWFFPPVR